MTLFVDLQRRVETIMKAGRPIEDAEEVINDKDHDLSDDERAALWLWAWSLLPRPRQLDEAMRYLDLADSVDQD